ncbi:MAG: sensor histidine kinase [Spirochaetota bacterium]
MGKRRPLPYRVLVVDDEVLLGELVSAVLGDRGFAVEHVLSGEEALVLLADDPAFDLVLMDIRLGRERMDGGQAAAGISARLGLPIVFYTAHADEETLRRTDAVPAYGYVRKSTDDASLLVRSVQRAIEHHERARRLKAESVRDRSLLQEAHHRIKNNLTILAARLRLEAPLLPESCRSVTERFRGHVHSIEKLHGLLQEDSGNDSVDLSSYLERVLSALFGPESPAKVSFAVTGTTLSVAAKTAAPIGMIASEIGLNAVKHSFSPATTNRFEVRLERTRDGVSVRMITSGPPIPADADLEDTGLGMRLVHILTQQLRGSFTVRRDAPPEFILSIPFT